MINDIKTGISRALYAEFGNKYAIYADAVTQDLSTPCFYIDHINTAETPRISGRCRMLNRFDVMFFPTDGTAHAQSEIADVMYEMLYALKLIVLPDGSKLRAIDVSTQTTDGILHVQLNYNLTLKESTYEENMEEIEHTEGVI
jgi:hypothetical protein